MKNKNPYGWNCLETSSSPFAFPSRFTSLITVGYKKEQFKKSLTETAFDKSDLLTPPVPLTGYPSSVILVSFSPNCVIAVMKYFGGSLLWENKWELEKSSQRKESFFEALPRKVSSIRLLTKRSGVFLCLSRPCFLFNFTLSSGKVVDVLVNVL